MATVNALPGNLPVFDGKDCEYWCVKMNAILGFQELDEIKISHAATSKQAWDILQQVYDNTGRTKKVKLQYLRRQYELLSMTEQETITDYFNRIQVVTNSMRACDEAMTDSKIMEKMLRTLTPSFDHIVVAIKESKDLVKVIVEELQNSLEAHEQRVLERKSNDKVAEQTLQARTSHKSRGRGGWNKRGRGRQAEVVIEM
ncbi:hypothetical protein CR513_35377, partial [Mucuna pruriens]